METTANKHQAVVCYDLFKGRLEKLREKSNQVIFFIAFTQRLIVSAPDVPAGLDYTEVTQTSVNVTFMGVMGADLYNLIVSPPSLTINVTTTEYQITGLDPGTTYTITVQALSPDDVPLGRLLGVESAPIEVTTGKNLRPK